MDECFMTLNKAFSIFGEAPFVLSSKQKRKETQRTALKYKWDSVDLTEIENPEDGAQSKANNTSGLLGKINSKIDSKLSISIWNPFQFPVQLFNIVNYCEFHSC